MTVNKITIKQKEQLLKIVPSKDGQLKYRPCKVTLKNGDKLDNVYLVDEDSYFKVWGVMPNHDSGKKSVLIEDVVEIEDSPNRLPPNLADKIYESGESGMGYCIFKIVFDNGDILDVLTGNAVDFVPIPSGLTSQNIKDVVPHQGSRIKYKDGPEYYWCLFEDKI
jgi:hypothetical protein